MKNIFIHNASLLKIIIAAFSITLLSGCADAIPIQYSKEIEQVGFWYGLWHGINCTFQFYNFTIQ